MTIGYYAIPPSHGWPHRPKTEPWPFCRGCADRLGVTRVVPIDEKASASMKCRGCKLKLRDWR